MRKLVVVLTTWLVIAAPAAAAAPRFSMDEIEREVMCPVCGTRLDLSHSPAAEQIRDFIAVKRDQGWTKQQVEEALVAQFGQQILADTPTSGSGIGAWVVPVLVGAGGIALAIAVLVAWRRRAGPASAPAGPLDAEADRRVDEALARYSEDDG